MKNNKIKSSIIISLILVNLLLSACTSENYEGGQILNQSNLSILNEESIDSYESPVIIPKNITLVPVLYEESIPEVFIQRINLTKDISFIYIQPTWTEDEENLGYLFSAYDSSKDIYFKISNLQYVGYDFDFYVEYMVDEGLDNLESMDEFANIKGEVINLNNMDIYQLTYDTLIYDEWHFTKEYMIIHNDNLISLSFISWNKSKLVDNSDIGYILDSLELIV